MNITLSEIKTQQDRLCQEIMERECLLAAYDIVAKHLANGRAPSSINLGLLIPTLTSSAPTHELKELTAPMSAPESPALPPPPPVERYLHPEIKALGSHSDTALVRWAVSQMTRDYSLHHLAALLERAGMTLRGARISVVLSRLKRNREIEEVIPGRGPIPALFRQPEITRPPDFQPLDEDLRLPAGAAEGLARAAENASLLRSLLSRARLTAPAHEVPREA